MPFPGAPPRLTFLRLLFAAKFIARSSDQTSPLAYRCRNSSFSKGTFARVTAGLECWQNILPIMPGQYDEGNWRKCLSPPLKKLTSPPIVAEAR